MGYYTTFAGELGITPDLRPKHRNYLDSFLDIRHMARDEAIAATLSDPVREAVGLPVGLDGAFFVGEGSEFNYGNPRISIQDRAAGGVFDMNAPPGHDLHAFIIPKNIANPKFGKRCTAPLGDGGNGHRFAGGERPPGHEFCEWGTYLKGVYDNPQTQPGLWAEWSLRDSTEQILWLGDEAVKAYHAREWLEYLIEHFFAPWGYLLNGTVTWIGEDEDDRGKWEVVDSDIQEWGVEFTYVRR
ncbi:MAG: hypothetical protein DRQ56_03600 [Gammaproteobacteria bacterium]|nr:MAG: hypothetical protein DRQ56_03600 [Gammaproteobacteria bacterium]